MIRYPLEGVRVLDLCQLQAGNSANYILADLGAEVIKVESTQYWQFGVRGQMARPSKGEQAGYFQRDPGERPWERTTGFHSYCRNKLSMTVDLKRPEGVHIFKQLIKVSDIFIESNSPDTVERLGIDYPQLKEVNPALIMLRMSSYGLTGPYRNFSSMAQNVEAFCGHTSLRGYPGLDPTFTPLGIMADGVAGVGVAIAVLMALRYRRQTGKGQLIELAQAENFIPMLSQAYMDFILNQRVQTTLGNRHPSAAPCGAYPCAGDDRWVAITVHNDEEWSGLRRALGDPDWAKAPELATMVERYREQDAIDKHLAEWTRGRSPREVMELLQKEGVPAGPITDGRDVLNDPHNRARGHFQEITHPEVGTYEAVAIPWKMSELELRIRHPAPLLGQHNEYVYKELLGYSDEEYTRLENEGHIGNVPAEHIP
ncbi:MAG: CoA transferase [Chloroflexi bacterium]|nr:CoA transferase [Chloroflexota bacterium]